MSNSVSRKDTIGTIYEAIAWLLLNPILFGVFFVVGLLTALGDLPGATGLGFLLVGFFVAIYADGLVHVVGHRETTGESTDLGRASTTVLRQFPSLVGITIGFSVAVFVGLLLFVLPGIYLGLRLSLAFPACVIDGQDAGRSLETSWSVAEGNLAKLFGISLTSALVIVPVDRLVVDFGDGIDPTALAVSAVATAVVLPVAQFAIARVYLENRPGSGTATDDEPHREPSARESIADERTQVTRDDHRW